MTAPALSPVTSLDMARRIVNFEARRDSNHRIQVYSLPANDGGGAYEVAGINERYHPQVAARLADLIRRGDHQQAEEEAALYLEKYTGIVLAWSDELPAGVEFFLRDSVFNRGPSGAAKILQYALGVKVDGKVGPITKGALKDMLRTPFALMGLLRQARETYERDNVGYRSNFWRGLENRWNAATEAAGQFEVTSQISRLAAAVETIASRPHPAE